MTSTVDGGIAEAHVGVFDAGSREWIDTTALRTTVRSYQTVGEFVDEGQFLQAGGGPTEQVTTEGDTTITLSFTYDAQRRRTGFRASKRVPQATFSTHSEMYTAWDAKGRPLAGTAGIHPGGTPAEVCSNKLVSYSYDDSRRRAVKSYDGGTNFSIPPFDLCDASDLVEVFSFDERFIPIAVVSHTPVSIVVEDWVVIDTAVVCK